MHTQTRMSTSHVLVVVVALMMSFGCRPAAQSPGENVGPYLQEVVPVRIRAAELLGVLGAEDPMPILYDAVSAAPMRPTRCSR